MKSDWALELVAHIGGGVEWGGVGLVESIESTQMKARMGAWSGIPGLERCWVDRSGVSQGIGSESLQWWGWNVKSGRDRRAMGWGTRNTTRG